MATCTVCGKRGVNPTSMWTAFADEDDYLAACDHCGRGLFDSPARVCFECIRAGRVEREERRGRTTASRTGGGIVSRASTAWQCPECGEWNAVVDRVLVDDAEDRVPPAGPRDDRPVGDPSGGRGGDVPTDDEVEEIMNSTRQGMYDMYISSAEMHLSIARDALQDGDEEMAEAEARDAFEMYEKALEVMQNDDVELREVVDADEELQEIQQILEEAGAT